MSGDGRTPLLATDAFKEPPRSKLLGFCKRCTCCFCGTVGFLIATSLGQFFWLSSKCVPGEPLPPPHSWKFAHDGLEAHMEAQRNSEQANINGLPSEVDVVVVGAGYAGLTAARELKKAGKTVVVMEGNARAGGRTFSYDLAPELSRKEAGYLEFGGQWLGYREHQPDAWSLIVDEMNATVDNYGLGIGPGLTVIYDALEPDGSLLGITSLRGVFGLAVFLWQTAPAIVDAYLAFYAIGKVAKLPLDVQAQNSRMSMQDWICANSNQESSRAAMRGYILGLFSAEPESWSFVAVSNDISGGNPFTDLKSDQAYRIVGGTGKIAETMAAQLGDTVRLRLPVTGIAQDGAGVSVTARPVGHQEAVEVKAQYVVMTGSPYATSNIAFSPPLPERKQHFIDNVQMGTSVKAQLVYNSPWWREDGWSGFTVSYIDIVADGVPILFSSCMDNEPLGLKDPPGVITCFCAGKCVHTFLKLPESKRRNVLASYLAKTWGPKALTPLLYREYNWITDIYAGGAITAIIPPGPEMPNMTDLLSDFGRVMWAGADYRGTANNNGYIDGAIAGGREAVHQKILPNL